MDNYVGGAASLGTEFWLGVAVVVLVVSLVVRSWAKRQEAAFRHITTDDERDRVRQALSVSSMVGHVAFGFCVGLAIRILMGGE